MENKFSTKEALRFGWDTMKANFWFFVGVLIVIYAASLVLSLGATALERMEGIGGAVALAGLLRFVSWVLQMIMGIGLIKIAVNLADKKKVEFADLFRHYRYFWKYLGASILFVLAMLGVLIVSLILYYIFSLFLGQGGMVAQLMQVIVGLLGVVGVLAAIFFSVRLKFFNFLVVDRDMGPVQSIKASYEATDKVFWPLLGFMILMVLINILGAIILLVGLFATIPTTLLATAFVYKKLLSQTSVS